MIKKISKVLTILVVFAAVQTTALAALTDASLAGVDNGANVIDQANGFQFDLNGGQTNINWNKFNVGANEVVNYNFTQANSTAFNQINSIGGASTIAGQINAIGSGAASSNIIISNSAGVLFTNGAVLNVGAMTVNSDKPISVEGLTVNNGNLFLNTTNGRVDVKGVIFKNAGDITVKAKGGNVAIGGIENANTVDVQTNKSIYVKAEEFKVGNKAVSGITSEYIKLASTNGGTINVEGGKIVVGKDFLALTAGYFVDEPSNYPSEDVKTIVTKNGNYYHIGYGGRGSSEIKDATIVTKNGTFKIFASSLTTDNSSISNFTVSSNNFKVLNNSNIAELNVALDGTHNNDTPTQIIDSKVGTLNMEFSTLKLQNAQIENLNSIGVEISKLVDTDKTVIDNAYINGGSIALNVNDYVGNFTADNNATIAMDTVTVKNAMNLNGVKDVTLKNMKGSVSIADGSKVNGTTTVQTSNFKAANAKFNTIEQIGGTVALTDSTVNTINSNSSKTYSDGTLTLIGSTVNNSLTTDLLYNVNITDSTVKNPATIGANWLRVNDSTLNIASGKISNSIIAQNSNLNASNLKVTNCIDAKNSTLTLADANVGHHLILDNTAFNASNTKVAMNAYITNSNNNDITANNVNSVVNTLSGANSGLYIGYTPAMGDYKGQPTSLATNYTGNIEVNGDMANKAVSIATAGDIKFNASNVRSLAIDNANSAIVEYNGTLKLNDIVAQGSIQITADSLVNADSQVGVIDSKSNNVVLNINNGYSELGTAFDANAREYSELNFNTSDRFNVYNVVPVVTPVSPSNPVGNAVSESVSTTLATYVNTLNVNTESYNMPISGQPQALASQFARNVRSLAVDSNSTKEASVSEIQNGLRLETKIMP